MRKRLSNEPEFRGIIEHYERSSDAALAAEDDAAARLALAAPYLLDACRTALRVIVGAKSHRVGLRNSRVNAAQALRRAIAMAKGRAPRRRNGHTYRSARKHSA